MKKSRLLFFIFSVLLASSPLLHAQESVRVKGVVKSAETGEPLFGAYVLNGTRGGYGDR